MDKFHFALKKKYKIVFTSQNPRVIDLPDSEESEKVRLVAALRDLSDEINLNDIVRIEPCYVLKETIEEMRPLWKLKENL